MNSSAQSEVELFQEQRTRLLQIAYGLLGSRSDAEDVVQEAYLRFRRANQESLRSAKGADAHHQSVEELANPSGGAPNAAPVLRVFLRSPQAWLTTVTTRLALDCLRSAHHRRALYPGTWLPEPVVEMKSPEEEQIASANLSLALLFLFEQLEPHERAVYLLREVFDVPYSDIAATLEKSEPACRQIFSRARASLRRSSLESPSEEEKSNRSVLNQDAKARLVERYAQAILRADETALRSVLAEDAVLFSDGGGKVPASINPIFGSDRIWRFFKGLAGKYASRDISHMPVLVNGEPGLLILIDGFIDTVVAFGFAPNGITSVLNVRNPEKLQRVIIAQPFEVT